METSAYALQNERHCSSRHPDGTGDLSCANGWMIPRATDTTLHAWLAAVQLQAPTALPTPPSSSEAATLAAISADAGCKRANWAAPAGWLAQGRPRLSTPLCGSCLARSPRQSLLPQTVPLGKEAAFLPAAGLRSPSRQARGLLQAGRHNGRAIAG